MSSSLKRIFICCSSYPPEIGGAPGRIYNLAQLLKSAGYTVTVFTSMPNYPKGKIFPGYRGRFIRTEFLDGIEVRRLWLVPSNSSGLLARGLSLLTQCFGILTGASRKLIGGKADLVYISSPPLLSSCLYAWLARLGRKKLLVNISDIWPLTATELGALRPGPMLRLLKRAERWLYRASAGISGQSETILRHVQSIWGLEEAPPLFLYRNLPAIASVQAAVLPLPARRVIYAGALGFAQGMLDICKHIDFQAAGLSLDIYGDGVERKAIEDFISTHPSCGIRYHTPVLPGEIDTLLRHYDALLIPLRNPISGAVPSKLFTALNAGLPVVFCSGGEGEELVRKYSLGWSCAPADYDALRGCLLELAGLDAMQMATIRQNVADCARQHFNKDAQDTGFLDFLAGIIGSDEQQKSR